MSVEGESGREQLIRSEEYRVKATGLLRDLLGKHPNLREVTEILGAQDFLHEIPARGKAPVLDFDAAGYVADQIKKGRLLLPPEEVVELDMVILPSGPWETDKGKDTKPHAPGDYHFPPRAQYVAEIISGHGLKYKVYVGHVPGYGRRRMSYRVFAVPEINKAVMVNDQTIHATSVLHQVDAGSTDEIRRYAEMPRGPLYDLGPEKVSHINYPGRKDAPEEEVIALYKELVEVALMAKPEALVEHRPLHTRAEIAALLKITHKVVAARLPAIIAAHPDWRQVRLYAPSDVQIGYTDEAVEAIRAEIDPGRNIKAGWKAKEALAEALIGESRANIGRAIVVGRITSVMEELQAKRVPITDEASQPPAEPEQPAPPAAIPDYGQVSDLALERALLEHWDDNIQEGFGRGKYLSPALQELLRRKLKPGLERLQDAEILDPSIWFSFSDIADDLATEGVAYGKVRQVQTALSNIWKKRFLPDEPVESTDFKYGKGGAGRRTVFVNGVYKQLVVEAYKELARRRAENEVKYPPPPERSRTALAFAQELYGRDDLPKALLNADGQKGELITFYYRLKRVLGRADPDELMHFKCVPKKGATGDPALYILPKLEEEILSLS